MFTYCTRLKSSQQQFYGRHHEHVDRYIVFICTMRTAFFNVSYFPFPLSSNPIFHEQMGRGFWKCRRRLFYRCKRPYSRFKLRPSCSFIFADLYALFWHFMSLDECVCVCVCVFSSSGLCPWITLFCFPLES